MSIDRWIGLVAVFVARGIRDNLIIDRFLRPLNHSDLQAGRDEDDRVPRRNWVGNFMQHE